MKIAYVLNTYPQPSHSFIRREVQALERRGFSVLRLAMRRSDAQLVDPLDLGEAERTEYILDQGGLRLLTGLAAAFFKSPGQTFAALRIALRAGRLSEVGRLRHVIYLAEAACIADRCHQDGVQHIHAHFGTNAAMVARLVRALGGPGYSFTTHGPEEFDAPRALSLGDKLDNAAFAVGVSQFGRSQLSRWAAFTTWPRLKVVHCGIEPSAFSDPEPLPTGPLRLVSIGRFVEQKGQMVLVNAMAQLRDSPVHLTLVGDGDMRGDLEQAIAAHGLQDKITLTGWLPETGVRAELAAAHALVMPSFAEGLPMVVMEAMAAARPVIATYIAGMPELVQPGITGWLVPAGDTDTLARAIKDMAATPHEDLARMGQAGRLRVLMRHDVDVEAGKLAGFIEGAVSGT
ncbi:glycosyltransferase [Phaeobacter marinintestinus]|uniref:glycosyltransferase n=1 Tax=Falsiphaeobacter marinintestinus TaxID=1492905 RepID=UPI0011B54A64|nr:glycosyltransferase [Phaeobacter marinintestinus]